MAGDWIKMRTALASERSTMLICDMTGLDEFAVVGRLHAIWAWAGEHTVTGEVRGVTLKTVDRVTRCEGFAEAMKAANWLEIIPDGGLFFPRWRKHNSKSAKERSLGAERASKYRAHKRDGQRDAHRDATVTNHGTREEKRTREKRILDQDRFDRLDLDTWKRKKAEALTAIGETNGEDTRVISQLVLLAERMPEFFPVFRDAIAGPKMVSPRPKNPIAYVVKIVENKIGKPDLAALLKRCPPRKACP
jgi:hypothetical protein